MDDKSVKPLRDRLDALEARLQRKELENSIFWKSAILSGFWGDYLEFGSYSGSSLCRAYQAFFQLYLDFWNGSYDHTTDQRDRMLGWLQKAWEKKRFIAFDSWEGLPAPVGIDSKFPHFEKGAYTAGIDQFLENCARGGVPREKIVPVKGFYESTLTTETARGLDLSVASVILIDCDLHESTRLALDFVTPYLRDGTVLIFDDWFQFNGHPELGEQRAFTEWRAEHPRFTFSEHATEGPWAKSFIVHLPLKDKPPAHAWLPDPSLLAPTQRH